MTDDLRPAAASSPPPSPMTSSVRRLPELTRAAMWTTAAVIAVLTAAAVVALWWPATAGLTGPDLVKARLDALKIGLSIGVGSGGVVALYLAWRRQHSTEADLDNRERALAHQQEVAATTQAHQERVADDARADAAARRITELYLKAAELLGSDKAPVRLSGLYALERLAQDNETQRQTIANVLCAYLRMPYRNHEPSPDDADLDNREHALALIQEREVRLTAQRLLGDHLKPHRAPTACWGPLNLDLTGAELIDFELDNTVIGTSNFSEATFSGRANFTGTTFTGETDFMEARFIGSALFTRATTNSDAWFNMTTFGSDVHFDNATFRKQANFYSATFARNAYFDTSTFNEDVLFSDAEFLGHSTFSGTTFSMDTDFDSATFTSPAQFTNAAFNGLTTFNNTGFRNRADFICATFATKPDFQGATFTHQPDFAKTTHAGKPYEPTETATADNSEPSPPD